MTGAPPERYAGIRPRPAIGTQNLERFHGRQVRIEPACVSSTGERKHFAPSDNLPGHAHSNQLASPQNGVLNVAVCVSEAPMFSHPSAPSAA